MSGEPLITKSPKEGIGERMSGIKEDSMQVSMMVKKKATVDGKDIANKAQHAKMESGRQIALETTGKPDEQVVGKLSHQNQHFLSESRSFVALGKT